MFRVTVKLNTLQLSSYLKVKFGIIVSISYDEAIIETMQFWLGY